MIRRGPDIPSVWCAFVYYFVIICCIPAAHAEDWPQWMGPRRDGTWTEPGILTELPKGGPKKLWSTPIHGGYSGPVVVGESVYVMDYHRREGELLNDPARRNAVKGSERLLCLNAKTGKEVWKQEYECPYEISYACGPRCSPLVHDQKVYTLGAMGDLCCRDVANGKVVWQRDFKKEYSVETPTWGFAAHPLIYKDLLICLVGGNGSLVVAFDQATGKEVWKKLSAKNPGYCPPTIIEVGGQKQLVIWHPTAVVSLDPATGATHWQHELKPNYEMSIAAPVLYQNHLFIAGMGWQSLLLKLDANKSAAEVVLRGTKETFLYPSNATPLVDQGTLYGFDCMTGKFKAVELLTGKRHWETLLPITDQSDRVPHGTGFLVRNGKTGYLFCETGELLTVELSPQAYLETSRAKLIAPTGEAFGRKVVWSYPAFANKCIFVRNDQEISCFSLEKE